MCHKKEVYVMPDYDFRCTACDNVFQVDRPLGYMDDEACPQCEAVAKRVFQIFEKHPEIGGGACSSHGNTEGIVANMESLLANE